MRSVAGFFVSLLQTPTNDARHVAAPHFPSGSGMPLPACPSAGIVLLLAGEWRWGAGALAGGAELYPLFDVLERRCRPTAVP